MFSEELREIYKTIEDTFKKYKNIKTIDYELAKEIYLQNNPSDTEAKKNVIKNLIDDILNEDDIDADMAKDFIRTIWNRENARLVAEQALKVINGQRDTLDEVISTVSSFGVKADTTKQYEEVPFDLDALLRRSSDTGLFKFRLPSLASAVSGAGRGNFCILFARPETGKTTWMCYETAGFLKQGLKVHYFMNEEPAYRVYLRTVCSALECSEDIIRENPSEAKKVFGPLAENLRMHDAVGMDIVALDAYCMRHKPDVLILDQLDKFHIDGSHARDDLRLGAVYVYAREIAKKHQCLVYGVSQASADAEGLRVLHYSMLAGSKTSKAAEADLIIGLGKGPSVDDTDPIRTITLSKNKINGFHGSINCNIDQGKAMYHV